MTLFDDDFSKPPEQNVETPGVAPGAPVPPSNELSTAAPGGEPLSNAIPAVVPYSQRPEVPEDLRISWSWVHLLVFILFSFAAVAILPAIFAIPYMQGKHIPPQEIEHYLSSIPQFVVGSSFASFIAILFFLYVTLSLVPGQTFWRTLGWRKFSSTAAAIHSNLPTKPWVYFFGGCALSLLTAIVGSRVHTPENMPIEQLLKSRIGAMLMMGMAVLVAPLVEETVFRGYLYPALARMISGIARYTGVEFSKSIRIGVTSSILVTGTLFGILHGAQLAWTWGIVALLIFVGIAFTYVRARTGTVFASYLMHLGYNGLIAVATIVGTHGFTKMPPHP